MQKSGQIGTMSIAEGLEKFLLAKSAGNRDESTLQVYNRIVKKFMNSQHAEGRYYLSQIGSDDVTDYIQDCLENDLSPVTVRHRAQVIQIFLGYCYDTGKISEMPRFKIPRAKVGRQPAPTTEDFQAALYALRDRPVARMLLLTVANAGLRRAELCELQWRDIDLDRQLLHVRKGKGRRQRYIPFEEHLAAEFSQYRTYLKDQEGYACANTHPVFIEQGRPYDLRAVNAIWVYVDSMTSAPRWTTHAWRRYCAKQASLKGVPAEQIQKMLGHSKILMTDHYLGHLSTSELRNSRKSSVVESLFGDAFPRL